MQGAGALDHQFTYVLLGYIMDGLFITPGDGADFFEEFVLDLHGGERNVPLQRFVQQQTHAAPVLGDEGQRCVEALSRAVEGNFLPVKLDRAARFIKAHHAVRNAELALTGQTADAEDLAFLHVQRHITHGFARHIDPEVADGQNRFCARMIDDLALCGRQID